MTENLVVLPAAMKTPAGLVEAPRPALDDLESMHEDLIDLLLAGFAMGAEMVPEDWELLNELEAIYAKRIEKIKAIRKARSTPWKCSK